MLDRVGLWQYSPARVPKIFSLPYMFSGAIKGLIQGFFDKDITSHESTASAGHILGIKS